MTLPVLTETAPAPTADTGQDGTIRALFGAHFDRLTALMHRDPTPAPAPDSPPQLDQLTAVLGLSEFERDLLLLCVGAELDGRLAQAIAEAGGDPAGLPTFGLALDRLPGAHWDAVSANRPLRFWQLITINPPGRLTTAALSCDEAILMHLTGVDTFDPVLQGLAKYEPAQTHPLPPSHCRLAAEIAALISAGQHVCLVGTAPSDRRHIAGRVADLLGQQLLRVGYTDLPTAPAERDATHRRLARAAVLGNCLIEVEVDAAEPGERARLGHLADDLAVPGLISGVSITGPVVATRRVELAATGEQQALWEAVLGPLADESADQLPQLASAFRVGVPLAQSVAVDVAVADIPERVNVLWESTRARLRSGLDELADRIRPAATWDDLVLPPESRTLLTELIRHARQRELVSRAWREQRGQGVAAMFTGDSGTGKTMAAEVVAAELGVDLYRIDLARVVDKYIGETEKNLSRVFDAAEASGAVLLFDEADALFGKRGEVKDARDRYANLEVAHLLTRMESYRGVAVLTTNLAGTVDRAFVRRLRFIVPFPFPDQQARRLLWQRAFPASVPVAEVDLDRLAALPIAGGTIHAIAVGAAVTAADSGAPVTLEQILAVAQRELIKAGKNPGVAVLGGRR
jgi:hypothetical protein